MLPPCYGKWVTMVKIMIFLALLLIGLMAVFYFDGNSAYILLHKLLFGVMGVALFIDGVLLFTHFTTGKKDHEV